MGCSDRKIVALKIWPTSRLTHFNDLHPDERFSSASAKTSVRDRAPENARRVVAGVHWPRRKQSVYPAGGKLSDMPCRCSFIVLTSGDSRNGPDAYVRCGTRGNVCPKSNQARQSGKNTHAARSDQKRSRSARCEQLRVPTVHLESDHPGHGNYSRCGRSPGR